MPAGRDTDDPRPPFRGGRRLGGREPRFRVAIRYTRVLQTTALRGSSGRRMPRLAFLARRIVLPSTILRGTPAPVSASGTPVAFGVKWRPVASPGPSGAGLRVPAPGDRTSRHH